jgi:hypothetical protein
MTMIKNTNVGDDATETAGKKIGKSDPFDKQKVAHQITGQYEEKLNAELAQPAGDPAWAEMCGHYGNNCHTSPAVEVGDVGRRGSGGGWELHFICD